MATQKPISTISYNTEAFLKEKLDGWVKAHIIQAYMYICHKGEDGDKDHIHLRLEPNKKLDVMDLTDALKEFEKGKNKPLGIRPWRPSKEEDWILYAVHNKEYLDLKYGGGEKGEKLPYEWTDIKCSDNFDVEVAFIRALSYLKHTTVNIATRLQQGEHPVNLVMQGENVYTVNAILRAMQNNDYQRLADEFSKTRSYLDEVLQAIEDYGLALEVDENGKKFLTMIDDKNPFSDQGGAPL